MPLSPMLVIGCGGSGGKVVLSLRRRLDEELKRRQWTRGVPEALQLKWIDVPTPQESYPEFGAGLPLSDYAALASVDSYRAYDTTLVQQAGPNRVERLVGWRPTPDLELPVKDGAGQMRAIGRAVALASASSITTLISTSIQKMTTARAEFDQLARFLDSSSDGASDTPLVVVVSSMAGGTGAGTFLDVCDLVRATDADLGKRVLAVLFTSEIFRGRVDADSGMPSNTVAAAAELTNATLAIQRRAEPLYNMAGAIAVDEGSGPTATYVVGLQTMEDGRNLDSPEECYRAVTESLLAMMTDERLQQDVLHHDASNAIPNRSVRGAHLTMLSQSPGNDVPSRTGFVSSFGSAKVSVGSGRFGEWARDRLARSVVDYVVDGWRERGLELLDPSRRDTATDAEIVDFLVTRDREVFFDRCGLWEQNEPDGTEHNQVMDGIVAKDDLQRLVAEHRNKLLTELGGLGQLNAQKWVERIGEAIRNRQSTLRGAVAQQLEEGRLEFADAVVPRVQSAVSDWLARYGLPVTLGLVVELRRQCQVATVELADESVKLGQKATVDASASMQAAFQALGNGQCLAGSDYVREAMRKGLGPPWHAVQQMRCDVAHDLLDELEEKVLGPLVAELQQVGRDLEHPAFVRRLQSWPDGPGVSSLYAPPPSEFCLVGADKWDAKYRQLLAASAESVDGARSLVGAGGFAYGPATAREHAPEALVIEVEGKGWLGREARPVTVRVALRPDDVIARVRCWLEDTGHPMGRFLATGLAEYLMREERQQPVPDHLDRLDRFEAALTSAKQLASPLFRVSNAMMQRIHPGNVELKTSLDVQQFPFDASHPARAVVERVLFDPRKPGAQWCLNTSTPGVESVLLVSRLSVPIHLSAVASLYQPIAQRWSEVVNSANPATSIDAFWTFNRARLLTEFIPLPKPSIEMIVRGWYAGVLLGMVEGPTETSGPVVKTVDSFGRPMVAALPWPLLRHGKQPLLHRHRSEWLPALLEHVAMAMMLLSQDPHALDGYQALYDLGKVAEDHISEFILKGVTPAGTKAQVLGDTPEQRKADFVTAIGEGVATCEDAKTDARPKLVSPYDSFRTITFGYELMPTFHDQLVELRGIVESTELTQRRV